MATILLIVIYIAFIGLGIPDSLLGAAWPAIYPEFGTTVDKASFVTILISAGTFISSLLSVRLINRLGTAAVTAISTAMTAGALLGFACSPSLLWMCVLAIPLGLGAGAIDTALNNYVALHYRAVHMNFLHCFYGIGVSLSPYLMSLALSGDGGWRGGYRMAFYFQLGIAILVIISLPLWRKVRGETLPSHPKDEKPAGVLTAFKIPAVRKACLVFIGSCAVEYTCGVWGSTFLVGAKGLAADAAAGMITFYYAGIALGRFLSGLLSKKLTSWQLIKIGQILVFAAIILLFLPLPPFVAGIALFLIGTGNGPLFPNMIYLTPQNFGRKISQSAMGVQMAAAYVGIMLMPPVFGLIAQNISVSLFPLFVLVMFGVMIAGTVLLKRDVKGKEPSAE